MSGIYIPGMEMPKSCFECKLLDYTDGYKCRYRFESLAREHGINISRPDWCPLVPIPDHGRLIDADALSEEHRKRAYETNGSSYQFHITAKAWVDDAPTIIPADKEG